MARAGVPLAAIQRRGRWASSAVHAYVEEALEEAPDIVPYTLTAGNWSIKAIREEVVKSLDTFTGRDGALAICADDADRTEHAPGVDQDGLLAKWHETCMPELLDNVKQMLDPGANDIKSLRKVVEELYEDVRPSLVANTSARKVHAVRCRTGQPAFWTTACGWSWGLSPHASPIGLGKPILDEWSVCAACAAARDCPESLRARATEAHRREWI